MTSEDLKNLLPDMYVKPQVQSRPDAASGKTIYGYNPSLKIYQE